MNKRITYNTGDIKDEEKLVFLNGLVNMGGIGNMLPSEKGFFNPILFLKKVVVARGSDLRKIMDFRVLNACIFIYVAL